MTIDLLDLADVPFHVLLDDEPTVLDGILRRLDDPDLDVLTVSAFGSAI